MDFFALNRLAERMLHKGDAKLAGSVYETDVKAFYSGRKQKEPIKSTRRVLNSNNSKPIGSVTKDISTGKLVFKANEV